MPVVALVAPMAPELQPIVRTLKLGRAEDGTHHGRVGQTDVVAIRCGIGTRLARAATTTLLDSRSVDRVIVLGIAGGIGPDLEIGDVVVPAAVIDEASQAELRPAPLDGIEPRGALWTSDRLILDPTELGELHARGVLALDMETAAVGTACDERAVPWSVVRGISDRPRDGILDEGVLGLTRADGTPDLGAVLRYLIPRVWRARKLATLARGTRLAAQAAVDTAVATLRG